MELKEVTAVFVREIDHINYLTVIDESGEEQVLAATDSHPFWVVTDDPDLERAASGYADGMYHENIDPGLNGFWVEAKDLREGDVFIGANGEWSVFLSANRVEFPDGVTVYNFTVDGNHNYFVLAQDDSFGQTCVLVHNAEYGGADTSPRQSLFDLLSTKIPDLEEILQDIMSQVIDWAKKQDPTHDRLGKIGNPPGPNWKSTISEPTGAPTFIGPNGGHWRLDPILDLPVGVNGGIENPRPYVGGKPIWIGIRFRVDW